AITESRSAVSATVRAMGPSTEYESHASTEGYRGINPGVVRKPITPQNAAGPRSEPPRSVPSASGHMPVARAAAEPPLDPPDVSARFHGFRVAPNTALTVFGPNANSGVFVLPSTMAPAARRRCTTSASSSGTWSSKSFEPCVVRMPFVGVTSLIATGMPSSGGAVPRRPNAAVAFRASRSAASRASVTIALTLGLRVSICSSSARTTWVGETRRARYNRASPTAEANGRSVTVWGSALPLFERRRATTVGKGGKAALRTLEVHQVFRVLVHVLDATVGDRGGLHRRHQVPPAQGRASRVELLVRRLVVLERVHLGEVVA